MMYESCIFLTITKSEEVLYGFSMKLDLYISKEILHFHILQKLEVFCTLFSTNITQENIEDVKIIDDKHVVLFKTNIHFVLLVCSI